VSYTYEEDYNNNNNNNNTSYEQQQQQSANLPPPVNAQEALQAYLASLQKQSLALDSKIDKEDDITPSCNVYVDISGSVAGVSGAEEDTVSVPGSASNVSLSSPASRANKNDSYLNDFLNKSEDLIAQTQSKLDKLAKLETVVKPLGPILSSTPKVVKAKPVPSAVPGKTEMAPPPPPRTADAAPQNSAVTPANLPASSSFSLMGFSLESQQQQSSSSSSVRKFEYFFKKKNDCAGKKTRIFWV
jgi:hypothetical protein